LRAAVAEREAQANVHLGRPVDEVGKRTAPRQDRRHPAGAATRHGIGADQRFWEQSYGWGGGFGPGIGSTATFAPPPLFR
jgi:hypothetical protein